MNPESHKDSKDGTLTSEGTKGNRVLNTTMAKILPKKWAGTMTASEDGAIRPANQNYEQ